MAVGDFNQGVLFVDVSGSTRLFDTVGDVEAHRVVELCLASVRACVADYTGRVVKSMGDGLLCIFPDAGSAAGAASEMQSRLDVQRRVDPGIPAIRVGIAYGAVLEEGGDVFGDTVNVASRLTTLATAGQVLTHRAAVDALPAVMRGLCRELYEIELRGIRREVMVHEVIWRSDADLTMISRGPLSAAASAARRLRLTYATREIVLPKDGTEISIGRDAQNDLVIASQVTSRRHARIRMYDRNFVVIDESANGTFVRLEGREEVHLRREEMVLLGRGQVGFGASTMLETHATAHFELNDAG
jgi:adenylate cyclase